MHGSRRDAQRALAALVTEVSAGKVAVSSVTLGEVLHEWLDLVEERSSPTTMREYRRLVTTTLEPALGTTPLRKITTQGLDAYCTALLRTHGLSPATIRHIHAVLRGALGQAVRWGWISSNPAAATSPPALRRREISPPAMTDTRVLLAAAEADDPEFGALLRVITATGARRGEVVGLRWSDLDEATATIVIRRSVVSVPDGTVEKDTKTHAARRIAVVPRPWLCSVPSVDVWRRAEICELVFNPDGFIFTASADGSRPLHPDTVTNGFRRICARLGLKGVRLHDLRHLHATQLLAAGVPVRTVSGRLGHANAATTLNVEIVA